MAEELANFERTEINLMLDKAITDLNDLIAKKIFRKPSPKVDWTNIKVEEDHLSFNNRPVFLADYTWKPNTNELDEFHGNLDGFFLTPPYVKKEDGTINPRILKGLKEKSTGSLRFIDITY